MSRIFDLLRAAENTEHRNFLIWDIGLRFCVVTSIVFAALTPLMGVSQKPFNAAVLVSLLLMLGAEFFGTPRKLYPVERWKQRGSLVFAAVLFVLDAALLAGNLLLKDHTLGPQFAYFYVAASVLILTSTVHGYRRPPKSE